MNRLLRVILILWTVFCLGMTLYSCGKQFWDLVMSPVVITDAVSAMTVGGMILSSLLWFAIWAVIGVPLAVLYLVSRRH